MKNVVMGLFDRLEDAEAVIGQLAASPLDLESIQVIHADTAVQRRLGLQAGIPARRAVRTGAVLGALIGAALGFAGGGSFLTEGGTPGPLASLGPLLAMSIGAVLGLLLGAFAGALSDRLRIPGGHAAEVAAAIDAGATAVTVRTENLPTAKAIGDLFQRSGSKVLSSRPGTEEAGVDGGSDTLFASYEAEATSETTSAVPEAHAAFAPPWRRDEQAATDPRWLDAATDPRVDADPEARPSAAVSAAPGHAPTDAASMRTGGAANTGLPALDGDLLFPSASPTSSETSEEESATSASKQASGPEGLPRTIRRGETVSTPDRTTKELQPREHAAPSSSSSASTLVSSDSATAGRTPPTAATGTPSPSEIASPSPGSRESQEADQDLEVLSLSPRVLGALHKAGVQDVAALRALAAEGDAKISALPGIGPAALKEVKQGLASAPGSEGAIAKLDPEPRTAETGTKSKTGAPASAEKRGAARSEPVSRSAVDEAAESVLREIFGSASGRDA